MKKDVESGIYEQRRWFRFFKVYPMIAFIVSECVLLIAAVVQAVSGVYLWGIEELSLAMLATLVGGTLAAMAHYYILKGFFSFFILHILYMEEYMKR